MINLNEKFYTKVKNGNYIIHNKKIYRINKHS